MRISKITLVQSQRGQSLIIIGVVMVGLIALMGLAIDGGNLFMQRRRAQNAADAVALAGTQVLAEAFCDPTITDGDVLSATVDYAQAHDMNSVDTVVLADYVDKDKVVLDEVGNGEIPIGTQGISVSVAYDYATYFVMVVGVDTAAASAQATAMTGQTRVIAGGMRPFGLPMEVVMPEGENLTIPFTICFANNCDDPAKCTVTYLDDHSASHRGWMNFNCIWNKTEHDEYLRLGDDGSCDNVGAVDMKDWMLNGWWGGELYTDLPWWKDGPYVLPGGAWDADPPPHNPGPRIGDYVHAAVGIEQASISTGEDILNLPIMVPVYDVYLPYEGIDDPKPPGASQGGNNYYHITGATGIRITGTNTRDHCIMGVLETVILSKGSLTTHLIGYGEDGVCESNILLVVLVD